MNIDDDEGDGYKLSYLTVTISLENGAEEVSSEPAVMHVLTGFSVFVLS